MAVKVRQRKGAWWLFIDHNGQRKAKRVGVGDAGKRAAQEAARIIEARLALGEEAFKVKQTGVDFEEYATRWLERIQHSRKPSTHDDYRKLLERSIFPSLKGLTVQEVTRERVKALASQCLGKGQSPKTVQNTVRCLSSLLSHAMEDGLILSNPAAKPGKFLPKISKRRAINPLTREEVAILIAAAKSQAHPQYVLLLCAVRSGLRQGELVALEWGDLNFAGRFIEVRRSHTHGKTTTPKNGESRRVDMSLELSQAFKVLRTERQLQAVANDWKAVPQWVFCDKHGRMLHHNAVRKAFHALLKSAGIRRVRFHDLRHTFASLLLQQGESPVYVKEQMGHSSIQVTVDEYGHLIPGGNRQAVDRLDGVPEESVSQSQSATQPQPTDQWTASLRSEGIEIEEDDADENGVSDGFRTRDLRIHNPAL